MSNPWSSVMPGGVAFSRPADEEDEDWGTGAAGDPVPYQPDGSGNVAPTTAPVPVPAPTGTLPVTAPVAPAAPVAGEVSTDVDTDRPGVPVRGLPLKPVPAPVTPAPVTPAPSPTSGTGESGTPEAGTGEAPVLTVVPPAAPDAVTNVPVAPTSPQTGTPQTGTPEEGAPGTGTRAPAKSGLHRLPSSPRGPRPAWMNNPAFATEEETPTGTAGTGEPGTPEVVAPEPAPVTTPVPAPVPTEAGVVSDTTPAPDLATAPGTPEVEAGTAVEVEEGRVDTTTGELLDTPAPVAGPDPAPVAVVAPAPAPENAAPVPVTELVVEDDWDEEELAEIEAEDLAKKAARKEAVSRANRPVAVTDRDISILEFLGRYRLATYPQIAGAFDISYGALRHRMPRLAKEGLVVRKTVGKSAHGVWLPTDTGIKLAGLDLPTPTLSWGTVAHTLGLVDIGTRFEALGETVVTEREIRAADSRDRPSERMRAAMTYAGYDRHRSTDEEERSSRLYVVHLGGGESHYGHIPDMVLVRPPSPDGTPQSVAVELELNRKPATQWRKILKAYQKADNIGGVVYFTHSAQIRNGIISAAKEVGAERVVVVRKFEPSEGSAVPLPKA